jgi:hypothetical protein
MLWWIWRVPVLELLYSQNHELLSKAGSPDFILALKLVRNSSLMLLLLYPDAFNSR